MGTIFPIKCVRTAPKNIMMRTSSYWKRKLVIFGLATVFVCFYSDVYAADMALGETGIRYHAGGVG